MMNSSIAIALLRLLALFALGLVLLAGGLQLFKGLRIDLTEDRIYTLAQGSRNIAASLEQPVELQFFYSEVASREAPSVRNYANRVQDLLAEFELASSGMLTVAAVNPEPFSEAEDLAAKFNMQAVPIRVGGPQLYLGLVVTGANGVQSSIPFLHPNREQHLEYEIAKAIYLASRDRPPRIGLLSGAQINGGFDMASRSMMRPWSSITQLGQLFDVVDLGASPVSINDDVDLLLVVHPTDLPDTTLFAIDQFVLSGRNAIVFVDPYAEFADSNGQGVAMPGATPITSQLERLFTAWGVELVAKHVLGDAAQAMLMNIGDDRAPARHLTLLGLTGDTIVQQAMVTEGLDSINVASSGVLRQLSGASTQWQPLLQSSKAANLIAVEALQGLQDPNLLFNGFVPDGQRHVLMGMVSGSVSSAFPGGPPGPTQGTPENPLPAQVEGENKPPLSAGDIAVLVVADTDLLTDRLWVQAQSFFGQPVLNPFADNGSLLVNSVDYLVGSQDLISIRSRGRFSRPFDKVHEIQRDAEVHYRERADELEQQLATTERQLTALLQADQGKVEQGLTSEQEQAVDAFLERKLDLRKALREVNHQLTKDIEQLGVQLKLINIIAMPLLLTLLALLIALWRRSRV